MVDPPRLRSTLWHKRAVEHPDQRLLRVTTQPQDRQVERYPPERLLKMPPERLLAIVAVAGHVGEVDSASHPEQHLEQFRQELALPRAEPEVVDGRHFCENVLKRSREQRLPRLGSWGLFAGYKQDLRPIAFSCKSVQKLHGVLLSQLQKTNASPCHPIFDTPLTGAERRKVRHIVPQEQ